MTRPFYMRLNWAHYHNDTYHLKTAAAHGAYLLLIGAVFEGGGRIKADPANLAARACCTMEEWAALAPLILPFFTVRRTWLRHKRVDLELGEIADTSGKRSEAGRSGGIASGKKRRERKALREANAPGNEAKRTYSESQLNPKVRTLGKRPKSRRCPAGWRMTDADYEVGAVAGLDPASIAVEVAKFRDHEFAAPRSDWSAAFRNWLRRAAQQGVSRGPGSGPDRPSREQRRGIWDDVLAERAAEDAGYKPRPGGGFA